MQRFSSRVTNLLIASLVLTIGRAVTLPFITIYLVEHFQLAPDTVGLLLGASLALVFLPVCMAVIWSINLIKND